MAENQPVNPKANFSKFMRREVCQGAFFYAIASWIAETVSKTKLAENAVN